MNWTNYKWVNLITLLIFAVGFINLICLLYLLLPRYLDQGINIDTVSTQIGITQMVIAVSGIGFAVLGLIGYKNIKSAAEDAAVSTATKIIDEDKFKNNLASLIEYEVNRNISERSTAPIIEVKEAVKDEDLDNE